MQVLTAIRSILLGESTVAGTATGGVHMLDVSQDSKRPNVMLMTVSGAEGWTQTGPDGLHQDLVRIYSRGDTLEEALTMSDAIYNAFNGYVAAAAVYGVTIKLAQRVNQTGDYQDGAKVYRQIDDYRVTYRRS